MHAPQSVEGALAWQVAGQLLRAGMVGAEIDMGAALGALTGEGVPAWVAAALLGAVAQGMAEGQTRQER